MAKDRMKERDIQHLCVEWFREAYPDYLIFSVPNESAHKRINYFLYTGLLRGAPDLCAVVRGKVFFVEMKTKYGKQSEEQVDFQMRCEALGVGYHVVRSLEQFVDVVETYL